MRHDVINVRLTSTELPARWMMIPPHGQKTTSAAAPAPTFQPEGESREGEGEARRAAARRPIPSKHQISALHSQFSSIPDSERGQQKRRGAASHVRLAPCLPRRCSAEVPSIADAVRYAGATGRNKLGICAGLWRGRDTRGPNHAWDEEKVALWHCKTCPCWCRRSRVLLATKVAKKLKARQR